MTDLSAAVAPRALDHLRALGPETPPLAYVDLDAFDANAAAIAQQAGELPVRVASKSVRVTALLDRAFAASPQLRGAMAFTVREALHLAEHGIDDVLIAYPSVDRPALADLAAFLRDHPGQVVRPMVDSVDGLELVGAAARTAGTTVPVCVDVDTSWRPLGGRGPMIGARRSPLRTAEQVTDFIRAAAAVEGIRVDALMAYDAQIAGVGDAPLGRPLRGLAIRAMQAQSLGELAQRLPSLIDAARAEVQRHGWSLELVNIGGTGSLTRASQIAGATELTSGSGLFAPTLFDAYRHLELQPAAFFVLPVVRKPGPGVATVLGGGYVASGPAGPDRLPTPVWPLGLKLDANEGPGEVQTPLLGRAADALRVGDPVIFRHAKAGELAERFDRVHLVRGTSYEGSAPTYRGEGFTFL